MYVYGQHYDIKHVRLSKSEENFHFRLHVYWVKFNFEKEILKSLNQDIESEFLRTFKFFWYKKYRKEGYNLFWKLSPQNILIQR